MISRNQFSFSILLNSSRSDEIFLLRTLKRWRKKKKVRCIFRNACKYFTILAEIMSTSTKKIVIFLRFHVKKLKINFFDWNSVKVIKCQLSIILQLIEIHVRLLFLHEKVGNIVQLPFFHLNKSQETIRLRLSVILGLDELIKWPHAPWNS